jgi:tetrahydromethanopterin S-methyltransferase subunit F
MATEVGPLVGALVRAIERSHELVPRDERLFVKLGTDGIIGQAIGRFLQLCEWQLDDRVA